MTPSSSFRPAAGDNQPITGDTQQAETKDQPGINPPSANPPAASSPVTNPPAADLLPINGISSAPLDLITLLQSAHHPGAGAVVLFSGEVRDNNRGRNVAHLEYESHIPLASKMIADILKEAKEKWSLHIAVAQHRVGKVAIGETAVVVITASAHRSEAYAANRYIIDRIKHEAPIWKCEYYTDGTHEWGNNCNCHTITGDLTKHIYEPDADTPAVAISDSAAGPSRPDDRADR